MVMMIQLNKEVCVLLVMMIRVSKQARTLVVMMTPLIEKGSHPDGYSDIAR